MGVCVVVNGGGSSGKVGPEIVEGEVSQGPRTLKLFPPPHNSLRVVVVFCCVVYPAITIPIYCHFR